MSVATELVITEFVLLSVVCFFLVRFFKSPMVTWDVAITVYLSWLLGFAGVLILPYDISLAICDNSTNNFLINTWEVIYWSTFFLAWVVLPIQMEFHNSGYFSFLGKLKDSIVRLMMAGALAGVAGIIYLIYMLNSGQQSFRQVIGLTMAMSNTYGVLLITILMGNGLVGLPRRLWMMGNISNDLQRLLLTVQSIEEEYQESRFELEDCELEVESLVAQVKSINSDRMKENHQTIIKYIEILQSKTSNFSFASSPRSEIRKKASMDASLSDQDINQSSLDSIQTHTLVKLHAKLIQAQLKARSAEKRWLVLIERYIECEELVKRHSDHGELHGAILLPSHGLDVKNPSTASTGWCAMKTEPSLQPHTAVSCCQEGSSFWKYCCCCSGFIAFWYNYCQQTLFRFLAILCAAASGLILWCELVMATDLQSPLGLMIGAYQTDHGDIDEKNKPILISTVCLLIMAYMSICTYWSLFRINIGWSYRLQGSQQSPPSSLIFNAEYLSRLQFALGYNFLMCLNVPSTGSTAFSHLMSNIEIVPVFGTSFQVYLPTVIIIIAIITFFDGFGKILRYFGIESEDPSLSCQCCSCGGSIAGSNHLNEEDLERLKMGKAIIAIELKSRHHQLRDESNGNHIEMGSLPNKKSSFHREIHSDKTFGNGRAKKDSFNYNPVLQSQDEEDVEMMNKSTLFTNNKTISKDRYINKVGNKEFKQQDTSLKSIETVKNQHHHQPIQPITSRINSSFRSTLSGFVDNFKYQSAKTIEPELPLANHSNNSPNNPRDFFSIIAEDDDEEDYASKYGGRYVD